MQFSLLKGNVLFWANDRNSIPKIQFQRPLEPTVLTLRPSNNFDPNENEKKTRYLGQFYTQTFDSQSQLKIVTRKARAALRHIRILENPVKGRNLQEMTDPKTRLLIYKTLSRARMIQFLKLNII